MKTYTRKSVLQFIEDLEDAGYYDIEHYHGRVYYQGPSVTVESMDELADVLAASSVPCRWDSMGLGYVVHPRASDSGVDSE